MFAQISLRRAVPRLGIALALLTACNESSGINNEPEIATMRLTVGSSAVNIAENGVVTGGPLVLTTADQVLTATFLRSDASVETRVDPAVFRLDVSGGTGVTFTRQSAFSGNIKGAAAGNTTVTFGLFHTVENHTDYGPFPVPVQIQ